MPKCPIRACAQIISGRKNFLFLRARYLEKMKCRKWVLRSHFSGLPKREDLEIVEEELPPLKDGGRFSIDPSYKSAPIELNIVKALGDQLVVPKV